MNARSRSAAILAVIAAIAAISLSSAMAQGPQPPRPRQTEILDTTIGPGATQTLPHYEWQYHYVGHHPRLAGHWVLVEPVGQSTLGPGSQGKL